MCGASARRSTPGEGSNDRRPEEFRTAAAADRRLPWPVGSVRALARDSAFHPADALECVHRALSWLCQLALHRSHLGHARRDADGLCAWHNARLRARHRDRAVAAGGIFPLPVRRHVPGDAEGRARAADHRVVRPWIDLQSGERRAGCVLPADGEHDRRPAFGRGRQDQSDEVACGHARPDLLDAATAERDALHFCRAGDRDDLCADRRDRGGIRRRAVRIGHADPEHELHHGRGRAILRAAAALDHRPVAQRRRDRRAQARAVLGPVAEIQRSRKEGHHMKRSAILALSGILLAGSTGLATAQTTVRVAWCAKTVSSAAAPFAIATKMGWYKEAGIKVELVPLPGSTDCVKSVATKDVQYGLPSIEPLAIIRQQGIRIKNYYTAYQGNIYGIAVPVDSPIKTFADLKGKKIGVTSMASAGLIVARALATTNGFNPDKDVSIVVAGEAAQTAALLRSNQVDALSQFDTQYALTENAGAKLRLLDTKDIARFPSNGFIALEDRLANNRAEAIALVQGYAKGSVFALANPEAAVRITWEVFPQTKATGKDEATALRDDIKTLEARARSWRLEPKGVKKWGENSVENYGAYVDFLVKNGVLKEKAATTDLITNDLIDDINKFDAGEIENMAKGWKG